jgi:hypothetical protein
VIIRNFQPIFPLLSLQHGFHVLEADMAEVYFHCSSARGVMIDRCGTAVGDLAEAREHADRVVRSLIMTPSPEDWRGWVLHVNDDLGDEIFAVPFAAVLGKPH